MNKQEKNTILELARFLTPNKEALSELLPETATPAVLGHLFFNRMAGCAYYSLKEKGLLGSLNREFRNSLKNAYNQNIVYNQSFFACLHMLNKILKGCQGKYAMLKGAFLCDAYPVGCRTSTDIDLLVAPEDVSLIGDALTNAGFQQGHVRNGEFVPATRREIVESKMMRGETVPYILEVDLPFLRYLEVDINFSLDYKNSDPTTLRNMLGRTVQKNAQNTTICTLEQSDFFIHLCAHLYKEATTLPWIKMQRDMTLYKFCDIYLQLCCLFNKDMDEIFERATAFGMAEICACVILWTEALLPSENTHAIQLAKRCLTDKGKLLDLVVSPAEKKTYHYTEQDVRKRFFAPARSQLLEEVPQ